MQVTLLQGCMADSERPTREELATIVVSGGGHCVTAAGKGRSRPDLAIVHPSAGAGSAAVQRLLAAKVRSQGEVVIGLRLRVHASSAQWQSGQECR